MLSFSEYVRQGDMRSEIRQNAKQVNLDAAKVRRELALIRNDVLQDLRREDV